MTIVAVVTVVLGFGRTFFFRAVSSQGPLQTTLLLHGIYFSTWLGLFAFQIGTVRCKQRRLHQIAGYLSMMLAVLMVCSAWTVTTAGPRNAAATQREAALRFMAIPLGDIAAFAVLFLVGWFSAVTRSSIKLHRQTMMTACLALLVPAIARWPMMPSDPVAYFIVADAIIVTPLLHERWTEGQVDLSTLVAVGFVLISQPIRLIVKNTAWWLRAAEWMAT